MRMLHREGTMTEDDLRKAAEGLAKLLFDCVKQSAATMRERRVDTFTRAGFEAMLAEARRLMRN